jgi:ribosomal-protein-alanine N-acetyltransferase
MHKAPVPALLETPRLFLRLPCEHDIPEILLYLNRNREHLAPTDPTKPEDFYTTAYWERKVADFVREFATGQSLRLYAFDRSAPEWLLGTVNFTQMVRGPFQACYLGYAIDEEREGQGLMYEATEAGVRYVFETLNFHRIMANHLPENERSACLLKRLGFEPEGLAKNYLFINGAWRDHVLTARTNPAWRTEW